MKARIVTKIPERVLLFAIDKTVQEKLNGILQKLDIQSHTVINRELGQDVGYLAGFHGFQEKPMSDVVPPASEGVLCMCGMSSQRIDRFIKTLKEYQIDIPIKATVTATNQKWSIGRRIESRTRSDFKTTKQSINQNRLEWNDINRKETERR